MTIRKLLLAGVAAFALTASLSGSSTASELSAKMAEAGMVGTEAQQNAMLTFLVLRVYAKDCEPLSPAMQRLSDGSMDSVGDEATIHTNIKVAQQLVNNTLDHASHQAAVDMGTWPVIPDLNT
jgi:hypothetical protein